MAKRKPKPFKPTNPHIRKEMAAHKRALNKRGYEGLGWSPVNLGGAVNRKERDEHNKLIAYAAALAVKRGELREGETCGAMVFAAGLAVGVAGVHFYRYREVNGRYGPEQRPEPEPFCKVALRNLNWVPAEPVETVIPEGFENALAA